MLLSRRFRSTQKPNWHCSQTQSHHLHEVQKKIQKGTYKSELWVCPVCETDDQVTIALRDRNGLPCTTTICRACGLVQTNPRFRDCDYADFYRHHYRPIMSDPGRESARVASREQFDEQVQSAAVLGRYRLISEVVGTKKIRILEIGCGSGALIWHLERAGHQCLGLDYDEKNLGVGQKLGLNLKVQTIDDLPKKSFDLIIMCHSLEHFGNPKDVLSKVRNLLSSTGSLFVEVPNLRDVFFGPYRDLVNIFQFVHIFNFTPTSLVNLMQKAGFAKVKLEAGLNNKNIRGIFGLNPVEKLVVVSEYPQLLSELKRHERKRLLSPSYLVAWLRAVSFPIRQKCGLTHLVP